MRSKIFLRRFHLKPPFSPPHRDGKTAIKRKLFSETLFLPGDGGGFLLVAGKEQPLPRRGRLVNKLIEQAFPIPVLKCRRDNIPTAKYRKHIA